MVRVRVTIRVRVPYLERGWGDPPVPFLPSATGRGELDRLLGHGAEVGVLVATELG